MMVRVLAFLAVAASLTGLLIYSQRRHEPLRVSGFVEADEIRVGSRVGGRVSEVLCDEGQKVTPGQVLIRLETYDLASRLAQATATVQVQEAALLRLKNGYLPEEVAQAKARVDRLSATAQKMENGPLPAEIRAGEARVEWARAQWDRAKSTYDRTAAVFRREQGTVSREDVDRATEELRVSEGNLKVRQEEQQLLVESTPRKEDVLAAQSEREEATQALKLLERGTRPESIKEAEASVAAARAARDVVQIQIDELQIKSPLNGTVEALELRKGDLVAAGAPVLSLMDTSRYWVRAYVPENRLNIRLNDEIRVTADSYPGVVFRGRITFMARQAEFTPNNVQTPEERSKQVFRIKVTLLDGLDKLHSGMPVDVLLE